MEVNEIFMTRSRHARNGIVACRGTRGRVRLDHLEIDVKHNETSHFTELLDPMDLNGVAVTFDVALQGLADFAVVQSYLATAAHWGITRFQALHRLFNGDGPWIPTTLAPPAAAA